MHPDTMRRADRWLGVPLCAIASGLLWLLRRRREPSRSASVRQVLFIELAEMGSVVLADPAIRRVGELPGVTLSFLIFARNGEALRIASTIDPQDVYVLRTDSGIALAIDVLRFIVWARRRHIDAVVDLEIFSRCSALLAVLSGARRRCGFHAPGDRALYRGELFTRPVAYDPGAHIANNFMALAEALVAERGTLAPRSTTATALPRVARRVFSSCELDAVRQRLAASGMRLDGNARLLLVNPNVGDLVPQRRWPAASYVELVRKALARWTEVQVGFIGSATDRLLAERLHAEVGSSRCHNLAGAFGVAELPALFELAAALVSSDSGPAHFAAVTRLPVVVLFGPESPLRYRPLGKAEIVSAGLACSPCVSPENQRRSACANNLCMQKISVDTVLSRLTALLEPGQLRQWAA